MNILINIQDILPVKLDNNKMSKIETKEALIEVRIDDSRGEGGTVIKESLLKPPSHWPDYSRLQMSPQNTSDIVIPSKKQLIKKKK